MTQLNLAMFVGNLIANPEIKYLASGVAVCNFRLAVNSSYVSKGEERKETLFIGVATFGKSAEQMGEGFAKGDTVFVEGRLKSSEWEDKAGGKRSKIELLADRVVLYPKAPRAGTARPSAAALEQAEAESDMQVPF